MEYGFSAGVASEQLESVDMLLDVLLDVTEPFFAIPSLCEVLMTLLLSLLRDGSLVSRRLRGGE